MHFGEDSPDKMEATAAMMKETMTPGPAISLATKPETTYIPVPTQLPTPRETRSTVVSTWASLVPWDVVVPVPSNMDSTGFVRRILECTAYHVAPHWIRRGSRYDRMPLIVTSGNWNKCQQKSSVRTSSDGSWQHSLQQMSKPPQRRSATDQNLILLNMKWSFCKSGVTAVLFAPVMGKNNGVSGKRERAPRLIFYLVSERFYIYINFHLDSHLH